MKDKFKSLFPCGIDFDTAGSGALMQNMCAVLGRDQVDYIENAAVNFSEMYEMLEQSREMLLNFHRNTGSLGAKAKAREIQSLLKRTRGVMGDKVLAMTLDIKQCNHRLSCEGFNFAYNTAKELAHLMFINCENIKNPYDPNSTDYEDFNETVYKLQSKREKELVFS